MSARVCGRERERDMGGGERGGGAGWVLGGKHGGRKENKRKKDRENSHLDACVGVTDGNCD